MTGTDTDKAQTAPKPCPCCSVCNPKGVKRTTEIGKMPARKFFRAEE